MCVCMCVYIHVCLYMCMCLYVYVCVCMGVCVCLYVYVCVRDCTSSSLPDSELEPELLECATADTGAGLGLLARDFNS